MRYRPYHEHELPRSCAGIGSTILANLVVACIAFMALWYWLPESPRVKAARLGDLEDAQVSLWKQAERERTERENQDAAQRRLIRSLNEDAVLYGSPFTTVAAPGDQLIIVRPPLPKE